MADWRSDVEDWFVDQITDAAISGVGSVKALSSQADVEQALRSTSVSVLVTFRGIPRRGDAQPVTNRVPSGGIMRRRVDIEVGVLVVGPNLRRDGSARSSTSVHDVLSAVQACVLGRVPTQCDRFVDIGDPPEAPFPVGEGRVAFVQKYTTRTTIEAT